MIKNIDEEINHLLYIKEEINRINNFLSLYPEAIIVSPLRYKFWQDNNLIKPNIKYYIAPLEIRPYIENYQG